VDIELLTVGTELVLGFVVDTNAAEAGRALAEAGVSVARRATVPDEPAEVRRAVQDALTRAGAVIVTGGLGPTKDDLTKAAVAEVLGRRLVRDPKVMEGLEALYRARGIAMPAANAVQADVIEGATVLPNPRGTAPGLWVEDGPRLVVLLPGVPKEMRGLLAEEVIPRLTKRHSGTAEQRDSVIRSRTIRTAGISESALADRLGDYQGMLGANVTLAFLPSLAGTDLRLTAWRLPAADADAALAKAADAIRPKAGDHVYGEDGVDLAAVVLAALEKEGVKLAVAESCTGGLLGARLTAIPGSSRVFVGGVVAYDNDVKLGFLGVSADTLARRGAVSEEVAREMASGVARAFGAQAAIAITGIAGPDGGTPEKPVGLVWVALRWRDGERVFRFVFPGDREDVRARAAQWALDNLRRMVVGR
jgi:competence/damage-inducible protein CinA-like protein